MHLSSFSRHFLLIFLFWSSHNVTRKKASPSASTIPKLKTWLNNSIGYHSWACRCSCCKWWFTICSRRMRCMMLPAPSSSWSTCSASSGSSLSSTTDSSRRAGHAVAITSKAASAIRSWNQPPKNHPQMLPRSGPRTSLPFQNSFCWIRAFGSSSTS